MRVNGEPYANCTFQECCSFRLESSYADPHEATWPRSWSEGFAGFQVRDAPFPRHRARAAPGRSATLLFRGSHTRAALEGHLCRCELATQRPAPDALPRDPNVVRPLPSPKAPCIARFGHVCSRTLHVLRGVPTDAEFVEFGGVQEYAATYHHDATT